MLKVTFSPLTEIDVPVLCTFVSFAVTVLVVTSVTCPWSLTVTDSTTVIGVPFEPV
jgi:hypothetical protein